VEVPPEVFLDRFLRSGDRREADRATYKGKQNLQALEPDLGSLLTNLQETLNADLRRGGNTFALGDTHKFHFDYVDATRPNALSFEHVGYAFICLTTPLVRALWRMCELMSKSALVAEHLKLGAVSPPRDAVLALLFTNQFAFITAHEFAHHDRGHFRQRSKAGLWEEIGALDAVGSMAQQAQEIDADAWAVYLVLSHLVRGQRRESTKTLLGFETASDASIDEVFVASFIVAVAAVLSIFPPSSFDRRTLYELTHPPQAARMNAIMHRVKIWCEQNRPALTSWLTLGRYQALMRAASEAVSELGASSDWSRQEQFFHTPAGAEYFERLHGLVVELVTN